MRTDAASEPTATDSAGQAESRGLTESDTATGSGVETATAAGSGFETAATAAELPATGWTLGPSGRAAVTMALGVVVALVMAGLYVKAHPSTGSSGPAACEAPKSTDSREYPALCAALNRPDLPALLGTPQARVSIAQSGGGPLTSPDGKELSASAQVQLGPVCVSLSDHHIASVEDILGFASLVPRPTTVLGHPAAAYSDHTLAIVFDGKKSSTGTGGIARHLAVAKGPGPGGEALELTIWRQDDAVPDDAALIRIAEQVLPTAPGWLTES
ncbi:hypothetical protein C7C46_18850 [Streptomyces tateyamensis]|uniref:Uncharacterized protein n=1 Tax=Streptomyces tateyamensis TaxID=565073 RepID=A0A2V4NN92_9ACTN|nr:DUF6215 domain-containing protein [Streptomyces tateyamensis]PYC77406.1 hypothetical protein C7C46_18850 [Streptomyces tateyamensis]